MNIEYGQALSESEQQILEWMSLGKDAAMISLLMNCSLRSIEHRVHSAITKLGSENRVHAVATYLRAQHQADLITLRAQLTREEV